MSGHYDPPSMRGSYESPPGFMVPPVLTAPLPVWQKLMCFIQVCPIEVNGFGLVDRTNYGFRLDDVYILEQTATAASVEVTAEVLNRHMYDMIVAGGDTSRMRLQWHSHVSMEAYFSSVDTNTIEEYDGDWMLSLVANKYGDFRARLDVFKPFRVWTPVQVRVDLPLERSLVDECRGEIRDKVRRRTALRDVRTKPEPAAEAVTLSAGSLLGGDAG